jgi:hypothetical protein
MKLLRFLPLLLLPALAPPPVAVDASLDGLWFKLSVKCKGRVLATDGSKLSKGSAAAAAYMHLMLAPFDTTDGEAPSVDYVYDVWSESSPETWTDETSDQIPFVLTPVDDYIAPNAFFTAKGPGAVLQVQTTLLIHVKRDKQGAVKSAKLSTLGGNEPNGANDDGFLYGDAKVTGKTIDATELPFTPP